MKARLASWLRSLWNRVLSEAPTSLMAMAKAPRPRSKRPTAQLYVIQVDFAIDPPTFDAMQVELNRLRLEYGLDFFIVEPGFKLKRFDDY